MNHGGNDIGNMRRDALRRTREMHRQNIDYPGMHNDVPEGVITAEVNEGRKRNEEKQNIKSGSPPLKNNKNQMKGFLSGFFSGEKPDKDKIIIIALILILAKDGADLKLLIALGYILA